MGSMDYRLYSLFSLSLSSPSLFLSSLALPGQSKALRFYSILCTEVYCATGELVQECFCF